MEFMILSIVACIWAVAMGVWVFFLVKKAIFLQAQLDAQRSICESAEQKHKEELERMRLDHEKVVSQQLDGVKKALQAENADIQRKNEEVLKKASEESFKNIAGDLNEDIRKMKESFEKHKEETIKSTESIKEKFDATAQSMINQTKAAAKGAEDLAAALRGKNKMQGCFGETFLEKILQDEGMQLGRDYDREETLRDGLGNTLKNEDSNKRMRPDFILHFPDDTDVIVDSKMSLAALSDYFSAETDEQREIARKRNYESVWGHVEELAGKEYQKYNIGKGRKNLDYVIMFIPNYGAYHLAKEVDPQLFARAYNEKKVLITTDETLIPYLRMILSAWKNQEQIANQENIIAAAERMVERVALFYEDYVKMGGKLREAVHLFEDNDARLRTGGNSIAFSASQVVKLGVSKPKKRNLPDVID